jgi:hypothetical protein
MLKRLWAVEPLSPDLARKELERRCDQRKIPRDGANCVTMYERLSPLSSALPLKELQRRCEEQGISTSGNKDKLCSALLSALNKKRPRVEVEDDTQTPKKAKIGPMKPKAPTPQSSLKPASKKVVKTKASKKVVKTKAPKKEPQPRVQLPVLTTPQQLCRYLGSHEDLVQHCAEAERKKLRTKMGEIPEGQGKVGASTAFVKKWIKENREVFLDCDEAIADLVRNERWEDITIDHIIAQDLGGSDWPYNYFLMTKSENSSFGEDFSQRKKEFVGKNAIARSKAFAKWRKKQDKRLDFTQYNPY